MSKRRLTVGLAQIGPGVDVLAASAELHIGLIHAAEGPGCGPIACPERRTATLDRHGARTIDH